MAYRHGIYLNENPTRLNTLTQTEYVTVAIGTAPVQTATNPAAINQPILAHRLSEFTEQLGYSDDFEKYTLCEVAKSQFELYGVSPTIFINVFDPSKHYDEMSETYTGETSFRLESENGIDSDTIKITTGENIEPNILIKDTDFVADMMQLHGDDEDPVAAIELLNTSKIVGGKFKVSYRRTRDALGGEPVVEEVQLSELEDNIWELTDDTILESVSVQSGGKQTLREVNFKTDIDGNNVIVNILLGETLEDETCKVSYHALNPANVTAADIIGGVDAATGLSTGIALADSVYPKWNMVAGILIAPKFSLDISVAKALAKKAAAVSEVFPAMAIADIDTVENKTYLQAIDAKQNSNLADCHLMLCYPKVAMDGVQYYLSTHLAGLMNRVDANNNNIPYVSPSNQALEISAAVLADGTEVYLNRDGANALNAMGIVTVFAFNNLKAWGNYTTSYPTSDDPREIFIPVRKMFNFISSILVTNYISKLDQPINKRMIEGLLHSANIYLNSLVAQGALLGGRLEFNEEDNTTANLMNGVLNFRLYMTPPSPAQALIFTLEVDTNYYASLF